MRTIAIINQKGGCGKTTTAINLSACLARIGQKTLLVDMDPQGHCAVGLAVPDDQIERTIYDTLIEASDGPVANMAEVAWQIATNFDLAPSNLRLAAFEQVFAGRPGREDRLAKALAPVRDQYDWTIIDCPPTLGLITFNALRACDEVIVPVETGYFSLHGLARMMETLEEMRDRCGREIDIRILPTLYDTRTKLAREVLAELRGRFREYLMNSTINFNTKLKEAASFGQPITEYDPGSRGYKDFVNLARELMGTRPVEVEAFGESLSRPQELVQRAKQLQQLSSFKLGRAATPQPVETESNELESEGDSNVATLEEVPQPVAKISPAPGGEVRVEAKPKAESRPKLEPAPVSEVKKTTEQKIAEIYGVQPSAEGVIFRCKFENASSVTLAGDFNNWSAMGTPMSQTRPGEFVATLPLRPGRYRYRLIVDGRWVTDPFNKYVEANSFGELNNIVEVG